VWGSRISLLALMLAAVAVLIATLATHEIAAWVLVLAVAVSGLSFLVTLAATIEFTRTMRAYLVDGEYFRNGRALGRALLVDVFRMRHDDERAGR
jgi:membrane protein YdbS with pleckstrin-like domain